MARLKIPLATHWTETAVGRAVRPMQEFIHSSTAGGIVLLLASVVALLVANSPLRGGYEALLPGSARQRVFGLEVDVVTLVQLIQLKRAAGRPKDLEAIAELEALLEERGSA